MLLVFFLTKSWFHSSDDDVLRFDKLHTYFIRTWNVHCTKHRDKYQSHRWEKNHIRSDYKPVLCPVNVDLRGNTKNCNRRHEWCQQRQRHRYSHHTAVSEQKFLRCSLSSPSKGMVYSNESWQEQHNSKNSKIYISKPHFSLHGARQVATSHSSVNVLSASGTSFIIHWTLQLFSDWFSKSAPLKS